MTPALETAALSVRVGAKALVDRVSIAIAPGDTVVLIGPNGAGKSTLLRTLSGELAPSAGAVRLKGRDPRGYRPGALALHRAVLSQDITVVFPFTVRDVVRMGAGERAGAAVDALVDAALEEVDLGGFQERIINTLSGGEQQRAHFARVLVQLACGESRNGPGLLLLDEPTASLDLRHQLDVIAAVRRRTERGTTLVIVLHDLNLAALIGARVIVMGDGRIAADGHPRDTITDEVLGRVFGVTSAVGQVPRDATPFVLLHSARKQPPA